MMYVMWMNSLGVTMKTRLRGTRAGVLPRHGRADGPAIRAACNSPQAAGQVFFGLLVRFGLGFLTGCGKGFFSSDFFLRSNWT